MPQVPQFNNKQVKTIYNPSNINAPASMNQKNYIITLCDRRKIPHPDLKGMTTGQAAQMISSMVN